MDTNTHYVGLINPSLIYNIQSYKVYKYRECSIMLQKNTLPNTDYAHKNITSNFSQARSALPEDGSQRIRNMSEFLIVF